LVATVRSLPRSSRAAARLAICFFALAIEGRGYPDSVLRLTRDIYMEMIGHTLTGLPDEACGLLVGSYGGEEATHIFPTTNAAASALIYEIDPKEMLGVDRAARALGADIMGVFHSHTHTDAYPSPTDVAQALDPGWHYVLVSLRDTHPVVRSYRIVEGVITEEPVEVPGLGEEPEVGESEHAK
jgi:proteasome lid subunit RPN8/RPN11